MFPVDDRVHRVDVGRMATELTITTAAFERVHGRCPGGTGTWAFMFSSTPNAWQHDLGGFPQIAPDDLTFADAKAWLREQGETGLWAVLA